MPQSWGLELLCLKWIFRYLSNIGLNVGYIQRGDQRISSSKVYLSDKARKVVRLAGTAVGSSV